MELEELKDIYIKNTSNIYKVKEILEEFFTEERVDFQNLLSFEDFEAIVEKENTISPYLFDSTITVLIYYPEITVTNEYNRSTTIKDVYIKLNIDYSGKLIDTFTINRATYDIKEYISCYVHSHAPRLDKSNPTIFRTMCLGSGPIIRTIANLRNSFSKDFWQLFCFELHKYLQTESISGGPYIRLESIGTDNSYNYYNYSLAYLNDYNTDLFTKEQLKDFYKYVINSKKLIFNYTNEQYDIGLSHINYIVLISNLFIEWINKNINITQNFYNTLLSRGFLVKVKITEYDIQQTKTTYIPVNNNLQICTFKNNPIYLNIIDKNSKQENYTLILNTPFLSYFTTQILKIINYGYTIDETIKIL